MTPDQAAGFWPLSPDVGIDIRSDGDLFTDTLAKIDLFIERGSAYAVAIDPATRAIVERGEPPPNLALDFEAIIDA